MTSLFLPVLVAFEIVKRIVFMVLYPVAYCRREWPRAGRGLLWAVLDDSIVRDNLARGYGALEYCGYGKRSALVEKLPEGKLKEFARSFYWGAFRNNGINLSWALSAGDVAYVFWRFGNDRNFYEDRIFTTGKALPYLQCFFGRFRLQAGWISNGRYQVQFRDPNI